MLAHLEESRQELEQLCDFAQGLPDLRVPGLFCARLLPSTISKQLARIREPEQHFEHRARRLRDLVARKEDLERRAARGQLPVLRDDQGVALRARAWNRGRCEPVLAEFADEQDFERRFLEPLLRKWGWSSQAQYPYKVHVGSGGETTLYVDQYVRDEQGRITLVESKRELRTPAQHNKALEQALSYARQLRFESVVLAAPQGLWLYQRDMYDHWLVHHETLEELLRPESTMRKKILERRLRSL